jgi:chromosome segregation ATPase
MKAIEDIERQLVELKDKASATRELQSGVEAEIEKAQARLKQLNSEIAVSVAKLDELNHRFARRESETERKIAELVARTAKAEAEAEQAQAKAEGVASEIAEAEARANAAVLRHDQSLASMATLKGLLLKAAALLLPADGARG